GYIARFYLQQTRSGDSRDDKIDKYYVRHVMKTSEKDDNELKRTMKEQVMRSPLKEDIGIDGFNEDPFDNVYEIPVEDIPSKKCVVKEKTRRKEKEYIPDIQSESALQIDNAKVKVMKSLDEDGSNPKKLDMSCVVGENEIQRFNSSLI
ncbi:15670_t:CDS:2, partial [Racocetra persica]